MNTLILSIGVLVEKSIDTAIILRNYLSFFSLYRFFRISVCALSYYKLIKRINTSFLTIRFDMNTSDASITNEKNPVQHKREKTNHLTSRVNKFQEILNQIVVPPYGDKSK